MVRHEVRRPNLVVWLITIWRRGSQERERPLTLGRRTRSWSHTGAGGRSARTTSARNTAQAVRPRPRGHGRRGKHVRLATAAPSGVWTGGWGTTGTPRTAGRPVRSGPVPPVSDAPPSRTVPAPDGAAVARRPCAIPGGPCVVSWSAGRFLVHACLVRALGPGVSRPGLGLVVVGSEAAV